MDTKSKKFNSSLAIKALAFVLAVAAVIFAAFSYVFEFYFQSRENPQFLGSVLTNGIETDFLKTEAFSDEYQTFLTLEAAKALALTGTGKEDYRAYLQKSEAALGDFLKNYAAEFSKDTDSVFESIDSEMYFKIEKIASHENHSRLKEHDFAYYDEKTEDKSLDLETKSLPYHSSDIPKSVVQKGKNADIIVEICKTNFYGKIYDGYYSLTYEASFNDCDLSRSGAMLALYKRYSYSEFKEAVEKNAQSLKNYKNASFAVFDNKTQRVVETTLGKTDGSFSKSKLKSSFLENPWSFVCELKNPADAEFGYAFQSLARSDPKENSIYNLATKTAELTDYLEKIGDYTIFASFDTEMKKDDAFSSLNDEYQSFESGLKKCLIVFGACVFVFLFCFVFLVVKCARRFGDEKAYTRPTDKIFFVFRTAINGGLIACFVWLTVLTVEANLSDSLSALSISLCAGAIAALWIDYVLYIARNIKNSSFLGRFLTVRLFRFVKRKIQSREIEYGDLYKAVFKRILLLGILPNIFACFVEFLFVIADMAGYAFMFACVTAAYDIFLCFYAARCAYHLRKIFYVIDQMRLGNNSITVDTTNMPGFIKAYADDVNKIGEGLKIAVDEAVRQQRTKTELITNVSHDLKTPLTSIINYVDLLSRCNIESEEARGYIDILLEKSAKLKRLIEDLVEASKAQTGAIKPELVKVDLRELAMQIAGEYEDEFEKRNLSLIVDIPENENIFVLADSKMVYRVLDNLFGNVKKYAMDATRVYMTVSSTEKTGIIELKNISQNPLNIPPEELTARFVRGDSSRTTDGNGLGLSIADNFCKIQGGKLTLEINADLFTARVEFQKF